MGAIQFWISRGAENSIQLPVNPKSVTVSSPFRFEDVEVAQLGEITVIGDRLPKEYTFESFFPRDYNETYCEYADIPDPWDAVKLIEFLRDKRLPMRLTVTGTPISVRGTIREFEIEPERAGSPGDIYFSMKIKEYTDITIRKISPSENAVTASSAARPAEASPAPNTYTVVRGDSLWKISSRVYGNGNAWRKIYDANRGVIGSNPNLIYPGQTLVIPS